MLTDKEKVKAHIRQATTTAANVLPIMQHDQRVKHATHNVINATHTTHTISRINVRARVCIDPHKKYCVKYCKKEYYIK